MRSSFRITLNEKKVVWLCIGKSLLVYLIIMFVFAHMPFNDYAYANNFLYPQEPMTLKSAFLTWDARLYLYLSDQGYNPDRGTAMSGAPNALYPLYPFLVSLARPLVGSVVAGFLLANLFFMIGALYLFKLLRDMAGDRIASLSILILLAFPASFYFSLFYAESLFFALAVLFFYFLAKRRLLLALVPAFLLPLTKPLGVLIVIPFAYVLFFRERSGYSISRLAKNLVYLSVPILSYILLHLYFFRATRNVMSDFSAQAYFSARNSVGNLFHPLHWLSSNFLHVDLVFQGMTNGFLDRIFFLFYLALFFSLLNHKDKRYFHFSWAMGLVPALLGDFMSYMRHLLVVFPLFPEVATFAEESKLLRYAIFIVFSVLQAFLISQYALNNWAG